MKNSKLVILTLLTLVTYSCKAQQINENQYSTNIVGSWVLEEDTNNKLVFTADGLCKVYEAGILETIYEYSFESDNCEDYAATGVIFLKWNEINTYEITCIEISGMTNNTLSLMIIDSAQILYYNRE